MLICVYIYIDIHTYIPTFNHTYIETLSVSVNDPCVLPVLGIHTGHSQNSHFLRHTKRPTTTKREKHKNNRTKQHQQKQTPRGDPTQKHGEPTTKTQSRRRVPSNQRNQQNKTHYIPEEIRSQNPTEQHKQHQQTCFFGFCCGCPQLLLVVSVFFVLDLLGDMLCFKCELGITLRLFWLSIFSGMLWVFGFGFFGVAGLGSPRGLCFCWFIWCFWLFCFCWLF